MLACVPPPHALPPRDRRYLRVTAGRERIGPLAAADFRAHLDELSAAVNRWLVGPVSRLCTAVSRYQAAGVCSNGG